MIKQAQDPPLAIGTRVRYTGNAFGRWRDERDPDSVVWVRAGDVGVVVANHEGSPGMPGIDPEPLDGWSTVRFGDYAGNDRALTADEFAPCEDGPDQDGECIRHGGRFDGDGAVCTAQKVSRYEVLTDAR